MPRLGGRVSLATATAVLLAAGLVAEPSATAQAPLAASGQPRTMIVVLGGSCTPVAATSSGASASCAEQEPVLAQLQAAGATVLSTTSLIDTITASVSPAEAQVLSSIPGVSQVVPDATIPLLQPVVPGQGRFSPPGPGRGPGPGGHGAASAICGTERAPELDPQALQTINASGAWSLGIDGAGVTVATIADGLDTTNPDLQRNRAYGRPGLPVVQQVDFSGDPAGTPTPGGEMFGDVSSIAAQGNQEYNLSQFVNPAQAARLPANGCWIKIVGAAPGASVLAEKTFRQTTTPRIPPSSRPSSTPFSMAPRSSTSPSAPTRSRILRSTSPVRPTTRQMAAGVTVVVSTGDGGSHQHDRLSGYRPQPDQRGGVDHIAALCPVQLWRVRQPRRRQRALGGQQYCGFSSTGFTQAGNTVNLVAPGDSNWALCSTNRALYTDCADIFGGTDIGIQDFGGTSESAPLTSAAAADVIQAYAETHGGTDPAPALVKRILVSRPRTSMPRLTSKAPACSTWARR